MSEFVDHLFYRINGLSHEKHLDLIRSRLPNVKSASSKGGSTVASGGGSGRVEKRDRPSGSSFGGRAYDRRKDDDERKRRKGERRGPTENVLIFYRPVSHLCYAYSMATGLYYVGYSGAASNIASQVGRIGGDDFRRRKERVQHIVPFGTKADRAEFDAENCAEVMALNNALANGENIANLVFCTFRDNNFHAPCYNCIRWIDRHAYGYFDNAGQFHHSTHQ